jgi:serine protease DegQ
MRKLWLIFSQAVTVLLAAWFVVATLKPELMNRKPQTVGGLVPTIEAPAPIAAAAPAGSYRVAAW